MDLALDYSGLLVIPRLRVQNANAISAPLTWGFPSPTAFVGLMRALERKTAGECELRFKRVGVICHFFEPQVTQGGYVRSFRLTRNPVKSNGQSASIVEEGRAHLEVSLVFAVDGKGVRQPEEERRRRAMLIWDTLASLRIAGGSILPPRTAAKYCPLPRLELLTPPDEQEKQFRALCRVLRLVPGFALISRHDMLSKRLEVLRRHSPGATLLDVWLDLSRLNWRAEKEDQGDDSATIVWKRARNEKGWLVPIPVGYAALSPLYKPGEVRSAWDAATRFRFVESLYSLGEWKGVHRLAAAGDFLWRAEYDEENGLYLCRQ